MSDFSQIDAYRILGLSRDAEEEVIRLTYHQKVVSGEDSELVRQAYDLLRDAPSRKAYLWNSVHSYFLPPPVAKDFDVDSVIAEVAFLSDWEIGSCYES